MNLCRCSNYRNASGSGWHPHTPGKQGRTGRHCEQWVPPQDKDTEMRTVVRESFVRTSLGLIDMATVNGDVPPRQPVRSHHSHAYEDKVVELLAQRDELIRYIEELLEADNPDVDRTWYFKQIQRMRYGTPTAEPQER